MKMTKLAQIYISLQTAVTAFQAYSSISDFSQFLARFCYKIFVAFSLLLLSQKTAGNFIKICMQNIKTARDSLV